MVGEEKTKSKKKNKNKILVMFEWQMCSISLGKLYFSIGRMMLLTAYSSPAFLIIHFNEIPTLRLLVNNNIQFDYKIEI